MALLAHYRAARRDEDVARLRRVLALRAMGAAGMSQRQIAEAVGITQPAVSQQLKFAPDLGGVHPGLLVEAAAPILRLDGAGSADRDEALRAFAEKRPPRFVGR